MFRVCHAFLSVHCSFVVNCWERANFLALFCAMSYCGFVTFPFGVLGQMWYLIVSIPDLCHLTFVFGSCFVVQNLVSFLVLPSPFCEERSGCFTFIAFGCHVTVSFCVSLSWCRGLIFSKGMWFFLVMLTTFRVCIRRLGKILSIKAPIATKVVCFLVC